MIEWAIFYRLFIANQTVNSEFNDNKTKAKQTKNKYKTIKNCIKEILIRFTKKTYWFSNYMFVYTIN